MHLIVMVDYSKQQQDAIARILPREQLQNCICHPDHEHREYRITAEQLPELRTRLRSAEILRCWITKS